ncbi:MAG: DUF6868 family protein [Planctomycetota bacterium]|jgi:hypothetical protein
MTVGIIRDVLGLCTLINYLILVMWFLVFSMAYDWLYRLHGKWFKMPLENFDIIHYASMAFFKICIFLFNLAPYLALRIVV